MMYHVKFPRWTLKKIIFLMGSISAAMKVIRYRGAVCLSIFHLGTDLYWAKFLHLSKWTDFFIGKFLFPDKLFLSCLTTLNCRDFEANWLSEGMLLCCKCLRTFWSYYFGTIFLKETKRWHSVGSVPEWKLSCLFGWQFSQRVGQVLEIIVRI